MADTGVSRSTGGSQMPSWKIAAEFTLDSAHFLEGYQGACNAMHGHTYRIRIEALADRLSPSQYCPAEAFVCDFRTLRWAAADAAEGGLDYCVLNDKLPPGLPPTAEVLARYLCEETRKRVPADVELTVTVWETPSSWVEYRG